MLNNPSYLSSVFISYRHKDAPGYVNGLMSELRNTFGSHQVFLDREDITAGRDFADIINAAVDHCELLLAVIGPAWNELDMIKNTPRITEPGDYVRLEIRAAILRKIPIIPVLIENAKIPDINLLPEELKNFATLQAIPLTHERWEGDIEKLFNAIENLTIEPKLARLYKSALLKIDAGDWQAARPELEEIESVKPNYMSVQEKLTPIKCLAGKLNDLGPQASGWKRMAGSWPLLATIAAGSFPNMLAAIFNYLFNLETIVQPMTKRGIKNAEDYFEFWAIFVNGILFMAGIIIFILFAKPVIDRFKTLVNNNAVIDESTLPFRLRCLLLGHYTALLSMGLWMLAGPAYPLIIGALEFRDYFYFIFSLTICGVFASAYAFFLVTWLCTHVFYKPFLAPGSISRDDENILSHIDSLRWRYLILAGAVPMVVLALGVFLASTAGTQKLTLLLGVFGFVGVVGFVLAIWLFRAIQTDIGLLIKAVLAYDGKLYSPQTGNF